MSRNSLIGQHWRLFVLQKRGASLPNQKKIPQQEYIIY
jgi:hypothetical protein